MSRGDRREEIFRDDVDRRHFLKTPGGDLPEGRVRGACLLFDGVVPAGGQAPAGVDARGRGSAEVRAERLIAEELRRQGWRSADLAPRRKSDPVKLALAARLRRETTLTVGWLAGRLKMGTRQSTATRLHEFKRQRKTGSGK